MSRYNKDLGDFGETAAENYLQKKGYKILSRNYCVKGGEIDIIAIKKSVISFIEVKTRSSELFGLPAEAVNRNKMKHMLTAAERYLTEHPSDNEISFDVIEVYARFDDETPVVFKINHIPNIVMEV